MTKSDLRTGMIVTCRNGNRYTVYLNTCTDHSSNILSSGEGWVNLDDYNEDLTFSYRTSKGFDIVRVERNINPVKLAAKVSEISNHVLCHIWRRTETKKMTVSEIEAILGYKIEVVSEK